MVVSDKHSSNSAWRLFALFASAAAALIALGLVLHRQSTLAAEQSALDSLRSTARLSTHALNAWIGERTADADVVAGNPLFTAALARVLEQRADAGELAMVRSHLQQLRDRYSYRSIAIVDGLRGEALLHEGSAVSAEQARRIFDANSEPRARWFELQWAPPGGTRIGVTRRIPTAEPLTRLALYLEPDPVQLVATLNEAQPRNWPGETLLLRRRDTQVAYLAPKESPMLRLLEPVPGPRGRAVEQVLLDGGPEHVRGLNRKGAAVVALREPLVVEGWYLVSMLDEATIYAPLKRQTNVALTVMGLLLLLSGLGLAAWHRGEGYRRGLREAGVRRYYEEILRSTADTFILSDSDERIVDVSDSALEVFGYTREQMLRLSVRALVPPGEFQQVIELVKGMKPGETRPFRAARARADGATFMHEGNVGLVQADDRYYYHTIGRDVSQQSQVDTRLRIAASFFEHSVAAIMISDRDKRVLMVNPMFTQLTGYEAHEVLGHAAVMLNGEPDSEASSRMRAALAQHGHWEGELAGLRKNGEVFPRRLLVSVYRDAQGEVEQHVTIFTDVSKLKLAEGQADYLSHHDSLTGLPNRVQLERQLPTLLAEAGLHADSVTVALLNVDRFKNINDSLGLAQGDALLVTLAERLRGLFPGLEQLFRYGSDEFILVMVGSNPMADALVLDRVRAIVDAPLTLTGHTVFPTASIGVASFPEHAADAEALLRNAGAAMRMAKAQGRNTWRLYEPEMNASVYDDMLLAVELRQAIDRRELTLYLQPQYRIADGAMVGMEALLRWKHVKRGMVSPGRFIPIAESSGLIIELSNWVLREACRICAGWRAAGLEPPAVAVNLSALQFKHADFLRDVAAAMNEFDLPPSALEMELTEGLIMGDTEAAISTMHSLVEMGIQLAIDDFGTGYSSLSYLQRFPVKKLKIDRSFVQDLGKGGSREGAVIANAVIGMARNLNLKVIAEGVETEEQRDFLREHGCDEVQGYLYARPMPADEVGELLRERLVRV